MIPIPTQRSTIGENLLERIFSPSPSPGAFAIAETGFFQGENAAFGDYYKLLRRWLGKPALQKKKKSTNLTFVPAHWHESLFQRLQPIPGRVTGSPLQLGIMSRLYSTIQYGRVFCTPEHFLGSVHSARLVVKRRRRFDPSEPLQCVNVVFSQGKRGLSLYFP